MTYEENGITEVPEDAERYVARRGVAVVVEGRNGFQWTDEAYVWLPEAVAAELGEAGALEYIEDVTVGKVEVYVYRTD